MQQNIFQQHLERSSVFLDRSIITPHYTPSKLPFREQQISEITEIAAATLHGKKADNLFIFGKVGTGKTVTVKYVLHQLQQFIQQRNLPIDHVYINSRTHNSKYKAILKALAKFCPKEEFIGYSGAFIYEKLLQYAGQGRHLIIALDEIDKVRDLDDLIYSLTRANDELQQGSIALIGISNNLFFKNRLDPRTKSALLQHELVFPPYNAEELKQILLERTDKAFKPGVVQLSAVNLAAAVAAQESGDARTAVMMMLRAGEEADRLGQQQVTDSEVRKAKAKVEEEVTLNMVTTLPKQHQLVLYSIAVLTGSGRGVRTLKGTVEEGVFFSGDIFAEYRRIALALNEQAVSSRWFREYVNELDTYGLLLTTASGKGVRGTTTLIKLGFDAKRLRQALEKELMAE